MAQSLDYFLPSVQTQDTRKRLAIYEEIADYLRDDSSNIALDDVDKLVDGLASWVTSSNYKVRDSAQELLLKLMVPASSPQYIFEKIMPAFQHKLWRVREQLCNCLVKMLSIHGSKGLLLSKFLPILIKLLEDQSIPVREAAVDAIVEIYKHAGERVRQDLARKDVNPSKYDYPLEKRHCNI
ncbi:hypothetical protein LSH36_151g02038 [Paralvinella palmiformis]|uniref:TOG domain-containing protein n=1 Tax=Paralvinella palmiformis TaxID=53620 RepID=A0AAD9JUT4_9ANNE|nr:hypothetical protein LSH36_151g02038 [Paralvinella palmiformis]